MLSTPPACNPNRRNPERSGLGIKAYFLCRIRLRNFLYLCFRIFLRRHLVTEPILALVRFESSVCEPMMLTPDSRAQASEPRTKPPH